MNWDAIGAIAELLGAAGVVASLLYLATQYRRAARQEAARSFQIATDGLHSATRTEATLKLSPMPPNGSAFSGQQQR